MKQVRVIAKGLFLLSRSVAIACICIWLYASIILTLSAIWPTMKLPLAISEINHFVIFYPYTETPFLLGEYSSSYLSSTLLTLAFYILFTWLLSDVFHAFKQERIFTKKGVLQLSRFYIINLLGPLFILLLLIIFRQEIQDIIRITFLHLIIGVFAFFMAAIFKQGLVLQDEQDLIF